MKLRHILAGTAAALALGLVSPALAEQTNENNQIDDGGGNTQNEDSVQNSLNGSLNNWSNFGNDNAADSESFSFTKTVTTTYSPSETDSSQDNDGNGAFSNNTLSSVAANQTLKAVNTNSYLDEVVDLDGEDDSETAVGYNSGNNAVSGNSFAAFAGILNVAWNTGINANAQAATNIAATGSVTFGGGGAGGGGGGNGGGGED